MDEKRKLTDSELHSAGAILRHRGPFADLPVPRADERVSIEFFHRWARPFYMRSVTDDRFASDYDSVRSAVSPDVVARLLAEFNWRTRIVAAYFAAIEPYPQFEEAIGNLLLRSDVCLAGSGYCVALAAFNTQRSFEYLRRYLDHYLTTVDLWFDQEHAMAAIAYLDSVNGTRAFESLMPAWERFVANKPEWNLAEQVERFAKSMEAIARMRGLTDSIG